MKMKVSVSKDKLLVTLKKNRENHKVMYEEARTGYIDKAKERIVETMERLKSGEATRLSFGIEPPQDHTRDYDQAISMVEWNEEDIIQLTADEFQTLVMDEWEWLGGWVSQNVAYSSNTRAYAVSKGML